MACQIVIDEMSAFTRAIPSTNASHVMRTVCPSLGYKNQPGSWLEDACFEIIDEHAGRNSFDHGYLFFMINTFYVPGALTKLFSSPKALDAAVICSGLDVGCPKKTKEL